MKELQLKEMLMDEARRGGICVDGFREMRTDSIGELVDYYIANPDWCMERGFPSLEILCSEFSDIEDKGVFVGKTFNGEVFSDKQVYIFHDCKGTIRVGWDMDNAVIPMLYFANGCDITIVSDGKINTLPIQVPVYSFGENYIEANSDTEVKFKLFDIDLL